jgi:hypothetical protein
MNLGGYHQSVFPFRQPVMNPDTHFLREIIFPSFCLLQFHQPTFLFFAKQFINALRFVFTFKVGEMIDVWLFKVREMIDPPLVCEISDQVYEICRNISR